MTECGRPSARDASPLRARRSTAVAEYDGALYFFGGVGAGGTESILDVEHDLWRFSPQGGDWERLGPAEERTDPWPEARRCCGFTRSGGALLCWGGSGIRQSGDRGVTYTFLNDHWAFEPATRRWRCIEASDDFRVAPVVPVVRPGPRYTPSFHALGDAVVLFGGYTEDRLGKRRLNDLWLLDCGTGAWREVAFADGAAANGSQSWPARRYGAMSAAGSGGLYVCGGSGERADLMDVWRWDPAAGQWQQLFDEADGGPGPRGRYCGACVVHDGGLWLFGGRSRRDAKANYNDTWRFDLQSRAWTLVESSSPEHRYGAGAGHIGYHAKSASAVVGSTWYLWGGEGRHGHVSDFWRFDLERAQWSQILAARTDDPLFW